MTIGKPLVNLLSNQWVSNMDKQAALLAWSFIDTDHDETIGYLKGQLKLSKLGVVPTSRGQIANLENIIENAENSWQHLTNLRIYIEEAK